MDCSRTPCSSSRLDATRSSENIILHFDDMCLKEGRPVISTLRPTIDRFSSRYCRLLCKSAAIYFLHVAARRDIVCRYLIVRRGTSYCGNVSGNCTFFLFRNFFYKRLYNCVLYCILVVNLHSVLSKWRNKISLNNFYPFLPPSNNNQN